MKTFEIIIVILEKAIKILDYQVPDSGEYLVLEGQSRNNKNSKIIHVLNLGKQNGIKIGRGNGSKE